MAHIKGGELPWRLGALSLALIAVGVAWRAAWAADVTIDSAEETSFETSAPDGVSPGNIFIEETGSITVGNGPALSLDAIGFNVTNQGTVQTTDETNATGVRLEGGASGTFANEGTIINSFDGAEGNDLSGIEVAGTGIFLGTIDLLETSSISVLGTNSQGLHIITPLDGMITNAGTITVTGAGSYGVRIDDTVTGLFANTGSITVSGSDGILTGLGIGAGGSLGAFDNTGTISVSSSAEGTVSAFGVHLMPGGTLTSITNSGTISASANGGTATAIALLDESGTLTSLSNDGLISTQINDLSDDIALDDASRAIAIDVSNSSSAFALTNTGEILGDVVLGSGSDTVVFDMGSYDPDGDGIADPASFAGDMEFGSGTDTLTLLNGSSFTGSTTYAGTLSILVDNSRIISGLDQVVQASDLILQNGSTLGIIVATDDPAAVQYTIAGTVTLDGTTTIEYDFEDIVPVGTQIAVIEADTLNVTGGIASLTSSGVPFLYEVENSLVTGAGTDSLVTTITGFRNAEQLGLSTIASAAYDAVFDSFGLGTSVSQTFASIVDGDTFRSQYRALLPDYSDSVRQMVIALQQDWIGAIVHGTTEDVTRDGARPPNVWVNMSGNRFSREQTSNHEGYEGQSYNISAGMDWPILGADGIGAALLFGGGFVEEDFENAVETKISSFQLGTYGVWSFGQLQSVIHVDFGATVISAERQFPSLDGVLTTDGDRTGTQIGGGAELFYELSYGRALIRPEVGLRFLHLSEPSYTESGGGDGFDLTIDQRTTTSVRARTGVSAAWNFDRDYGYFRPHARLAIAQELGDDSLTTSGSFVGSNETFALVNEDLVGTMLEGSTGLKFVTFDDSAVLDLEYGMRSGDEFTSHAIRAGFTFAY